MTINATENTVTATINADVFEYNETTMLLSKNGKKITKLDSRTSGRLESILSTNGMRRVYAAAFVAAIYANEL